MHPFLENLNLPKVFVKRDLQAFKWSIFYNIHSFIYYANKMHLVLTDGHICHPPPQKLISLNPCHDQGILKLKNKTL